MNFFLIIRLFVKNFYQTVDSRTTISPVRFTVMGEICLLLTRINKSEAILMPIASNDNIKTAAVASLAQIIPVFPEIIQPSVI
jgi:hypothetical protein